MIFILTVSGTLDEEKLSSAALMCGDGKNTQKHRHKHNKKATQFLIILFITFSS